MLTKGGLVFGAGAVNQKGQVYHAHFWNDASSPLRIESAFSNCIRNLWMSQQQTAAKPSLQGVRIKARKGAVKAHAKHEPTSTRRFSHIQ
jgi:hypothetical protein